MRDDLFVFDSLSSDDRLLAKRIMSDPKIVQVMRYAWRLTLANGREHSFFIYQTKLGQFYHVRVWKGDTDRTDPNERYEVYTIRDRAVAHYHSHPGTYSASQFTDWKDLQFGVFTNTLSFIQTRFGFLVGRTGHRAAI